MDRAFNEALIADMRANGGRPSSGPFLGRRLLILVLTLRSGKRREVPVAYTRQGVDYLIAASNAGKANDPLWLGQMLDAAEVKLEVLGESFPVSWRVVNGEERDALYSQHAREVPSFARYQELAPRRIPIILLRRAGSAAA